MPEPSGSQPVATAAAAAPVQVQAPTPPAPIKKKSSASNLLAGCLILFVGLPVSCGVCATIFGDGEGEPPDRATATALREQQQATRGGLPPLREPTPAPARKADELDATTSGLRSRFVSLGSSAKLLAHFESVCSSVSKKRQSSLRAYLSKIGSAAFTQRIRCWPGDNVVTATCRPKVGSTGFSVVATLSDEHVCDIAVRSSVKSSTIHSKIINMLPPIVAEQERLINFGAEVLSLANHKGEPQETLLDDGTLIVSGQGQPPHPWFAALHAGWR